MTEEDNRFIDAKGLRQQAERLARERATQVPDCSANLSAEEVRKTIHELRVHQIELEMQNEELRAAQVVIEEGRTRFFDLYELAPVGYCTLSDQGIIQEANLTAATLLGSTSGALIQQPITRFIFKDDQDIFYFHSKKLFETGETQECELRLIKADNASFWVHLTGTEVQAEDGLSACRMAFSDTSEQHAAEEQNEKLRAHLTQLQKIESLGRLAGGVAHDFNNMLGVILGYAELALSRAESDELLQGYLESIRKASNRSADLTRQLLAFARKQPITPRVLYLNDTVEDLIAMLRRLIGDDVVLSCKLAQGLWSVKIDPSQIDQILANLCVNARDAIADIGTISVETSNITLNEDFCTQQLGFTPGEYVMLTVSDDGCGMHAKTLSQLFEPFFTTKKTGEGTGLGLAIVYGVVKQNNGVINVFSELGQGTTFKIYLPRYYVDAEPLAQKSVKQVKAHGRETILLVDDEQTLLKMTTLLLEKQGYTVLAASSPAEGIRLAREYTGRIDLLMTDVVMPEMNGRDLSKNLLSIIPDLKRLLMSGYTANVIADRGWLDEGEFFIQKPFSMTELALKLRDVLEG